MAGNGSDGFAGDGGPALSAALSFPKGVAIDRSGNLYIVDSLNDRIRKVDMQTGIISTVAGGAFTFSGDGGPATAAGLEFPAAMAFDSSGNFYIADTNDNRIRKVDVRTGIISTVAGSSQDEGFGGDGGPATAALLDQPGGVAVDSEGNIYISDTRNHRVRKVSAATGVITTIIGNGTTRFSGDGPASAATIATPEGLSFDASGNLLVVEYGYGRIRRVDRSGIISTVAGQGVSDFSGDGGPATAAALKGPYGVTSDASGNIYVADTGNQRVRKVTASTGIITTVAGTGQVGFIGDGGPATAASVVRPAGVVIDKAGNLYIADSFHGRVRKVDARSGIISTVAGNGTSGSGGDGGPATAASLRVPVAVAFDGSGNLYILDAGDARVRMVSAVTGNISTVAGNGNHAFSGDGGPATAASISSPSTLAVDASGNLFIADNGNNRVRKVAAATGIISTFAGNGEFGSSGDGGPATAAQLWYPTGLASDRFGNVYISDNQNNRIRKVDAISGVISTVVGNGTSDFSGDGGPATAASLHFPYGLAFDAAGDLFIGDYGNHRIRKVASGSGIITTIAGNGSSEYSGDGGPATGAGIPFPSSLALNAAGDLYIADSLSNRVRALFACVGILTPVLASPASNETAVSTAPTLTWSKVDGAFGYDVALAAGANPSVLVATDLTATTYTLANLLPGVTYSWRVMAKGDPFCTPRSSATSEIRSFTTAPACTSPAAFDLAQPSNGASGVASSVQLTWQAAAGSATYDLYLGTSNPPALYAKGLSSTTQIVNGLTPSATYFWYLIAHAACDATKTTVSPTRSFLTAGNCAPAGSFSLTSPSNHASDLSATTTLQWSPSSNASGYDVYLGTTSPPPLYLTDVTSSRIAVSGLTPSRTYFWRVVAKAACDRTKDVSSPTNSFATAGGCTIPGAPTIIFVPPGNVGVGQIYTIAWQEVPDLDADGYYLMERSSSASFSTIIDSQQTFSTSASFLSSGTGTYFHRVRAVPGCDPAHPGPPSAAKSVNVVAGTASVIFTVEPPAVVTALGERLEDQKGRRFTIENLSTRPLPLILSASQSTYFFTWRDPLGGDPFRFTLEPRTPKSFELQYSGRPTDQSATYQGLIVVNAEGQALAITPYAYVNLKIGGGDTARPSFTKNGVPTEYAFFPGFAGSEDSNRPPITVEIRNSGTTPMDLGAQIGPEVWLVPEAGWNATPIPPGASRTVRLSSHRYSAPEKSALPRYTYFTVRSRNGQSARLLVQDNDALPTSSGRTSLLGPGSRSFIVPGVLSAPPQYSRIRLTNVGNDPVTTDLFYTPVGADGFNVAAVKQARIAVPPNDVVTLTDPLVQVFGLSAPVQGQIEIRADATNIGFLVVSSSVFTPVPTGGGYSYEMPTLQLGEGARAGSAHVIVGVASNATTRTALTLNETTGLELTRVRVILFDAQGARKGDRLVDVPRYGQMIIDNVVTALGASEPFDGGRIEIDVESGGGAVAGVVTILDAVHNNGAAVVSQPASGTISSSALLRLRRMPFAAAAQVSVTAVAPVVVNGPSSGGALQRTSMGFTTTTGSPLTAVVTYRPNDATSAPIDKTLQLPSGAVLQFDNVLEDLFGLGKGQKASGSVFISAAAGSQIYARLATLTGNTWTISSGLPLVPTFSDALSSVASKRPLYLDGLEQSIDPARGARWSVDVNEVGGGSGSILVQLYEAGNRSLPIREKRYTIAPYQQLTLDTIFSALDLDTDDRRKDRTNVLCVVAADGGNAVIAAVGVAVDNQTGDTRHFVFSPTGGVPSTGVLRITAVAQVPPPPTRRRAVH